MLPLSFRYPVAPEIQIPKPAHLDEMLAFAKVLSKGIPHVRADFYNIQGKIYFGELTFYPEGGRPVFTPPEWDVTFGDWLSLDNVYDRRAKK